MAIYVYAENTSLEDSPEAPESAEDVPVDPPPDPPPDAPQATGDFVVPNFLTGQRKSSSELNINDFQVSLFIGTYIF